MTATTKVQRKGPTQNWEQSTICPITGHPCEGDLAYLCPEYGCARKGRYRRDRGKFLKTSNCRLTTGQNSRNLHDLWLLPSSHERYAESYAATDQETEK
jgi:hypothetical protein